MNWTELQSWTRVFRCECPQRTNWLSTNRPSFAAANQVVTRDARDQWTHRVSKYQVSKSNNVACSTRTQQCSISGSTLLRVHRRDISSRGLPIIMTRQGKVSSVQSCPFGSILCDQIQSNPLADWPNPIQPNESGKIWTQPDPIQLLLVYYYYLVFHHPLTLLFQA